MAFCLHACTSRHIWVILHVVDKYLLYLSDLMYFSLALVLTTIALLFLLLSFVSVFIAFKHLGSWRLMSIFIFHVTE